MPSAQPRGITAPRPAPYRTRACRRAAGDAGSLHEPDRTAALASTHADIARTGHPFRYRCRSPLRHGRCWTRRLFGRCGGRCGDDCWGSDALCPTDTRWTGDGSAGIEATSGGRAVGSDHRPSGFGPIAPRLVAGTVSNARRGAVGPHRPPAAAMAAAPCSGRRILCHRGGSHRGGDPLRPLVLRRTSTRSKGGSRLPVRRKKPARPIRSPSLLSRFGQHRSRALFVLGGSPCALDEMGPSFRTGLSACGTPCGSIWTAASAQPARSTAARPPSKPWSRSARARRAIQSPSFKGRSGAEPDPDAVRVTVQGWPLQEGGTTLPGR